MASLNKIIIIGRLTADPELRYTPSGAPVANFTVAVDRKFSKNEITDFIPIVAWRQLAELVNEFCHKGKLVAIEGSLQTRSYQDKDGNKRKAFEVNADEVKFLDQAARPSKNSGVQRPQNQGETTGISLHDEILGVEDIPFAPCRV